MKQKETEEEKERKIRKELKVLSPVLSYRKLILERQLVDAIDESVREDIKKKLEELTERLQYFNQVQSILDQIIENSDLLKKESLTIEERKYFTQKQENLHLRKRAIIKSELNSLIESMRKNPLSIEDNSEKKPRFVKPLIICIAFIITISYIIFYFLIL